MFRQAVGRVLSLLAGPYGYTVTIWCTGAIASARYGGPDVLDIAAFALGAVSAFVLAALWSRTTVGPEIPERVSSVLLFNILPVPSVIMGAMCTFLPSKVAGFGAAGFVTTLGYILAAAALISLGSRER